MFDFLDALVELGLGEVAVMGIDRLELAAVDGHDGLREQVQSPAQQNELTAHVANRRPVVTAEVGNGLEVGRQAPGEPHQFDVALGFPFQASAGLDAVEVAIQVELEQYRRMIGRAACGRRGNPGKSQRAQVQFVDEDFNCANRIVFRYVVIQTLGKQGNLCPVFAFDESLHVRISPLMQLRSV